MKTTTTTSWIFLGLLLVGCDPEAVDSGIQIGDEGGLGCVVAERTSIDDPDEVLPVLGTSPSALEAELLGSFEGTATLADATAIDPFTLVLSTPTQREWVTQEHTDGGPSDDCPPFLELTLTAEIHGGSVVDAELPGAVQVAADWTRVVADVAMEDVEGSLEPTSVDPDDLDWVDLGLRATPLEGGGWDGLLGYHGCRGTECSPPLSESTAEATLKVEGS